MIREPTKAQVIGVNWQRDSSGYAVEVYGAGRAYSRVGPRAIDDALAFLATLPIDSYATPSDTRRTSWVLPVF
jgi:hypothetical protein